MFHNTKCFSMTYTKQRHNPCSYGIQVNERTRLKRSALHKVAIKELNRRLKTPTLDLV